MWNRLVLCNSMDAPQCCHFQLGTDPEPLIKVKGVKLGRIGYIHTLENLRQVTKNAILYRHLNLTTKLIGKGCTCMATS